MSILRVAGLQLDVSWEDRAANFEKARRLGLRARDEGAGLVVLPEMFATGFSLDPAVTAEAPDGETPSFIKGLARELGIAVVGGYVQKRRGGKVVVHFRNHDDFERLFALITGRTSVDEYSQRLSA